MTATQDRCGASEAIMATLEAGVTTDVASDVQEGTLLHFHQRFGLLEFDTIERMAWDPASGIRLTSNSRASYPVRNDDPTRTVILIDPEASSASNSSSYPEEKTTEFDILPKPAFKCSTEG